MGELSLVVLVDTPRIDPEEFQIILVCLFSTEANLFITSLALVRVLTVNQILVGDFIFIRTPRMRKYRIRWDQIAFVEFPGRSVLVVAGALEETHRSARGGDEVA